jgi:hypothetical protein
MWRLATGPAGNRSNVDGVDPEFPDSPNDTGGVDDTLRPAEALDPDEVRNNDGDEVVDPPDDWAAADHVAEEPYGASIDEKLAAEEPEPATAGETTLDDDTALLPNDEVDRIDPAKPGRERGQIDGTPEDGDSFYDVIE